MDNKFGFHPVIICGSKSLGDYRLLESKLNKLLSNLPKDKIQIISDCTNGVGVLAVKYAKEYNYKLYRFISQNTVYGDKADDVRDIEMCEFSTHCILFWDGSDEAVPMMEKARKYNLNLRVIKI